MRTIGLVMGVLMVALASVQAQDDAKGDLAKLQGTWQRTAVIAAGRQLPADKVQQSTLTIAGNKYSYVMGGEKRTGTLKLDSSKSPMQLDIIAGSGPNEGKSLLGIYELTGDSFRYCVAQPGKDRPTAFESTPATGYLIFENKRTK